MDIGSGNPYPAGKLSNFSANHFTFDGVECASLEGFLQSLKFEKEHIQREVCKLVGMAAKRRGMPRNKTWRSRQTLWWRGVPYDRHGDAYQTLLDQAYAAVFEQCDGFRNALAATHDAVLTHSIGKSKESDTVLTEREFCSRLTKLRRRLNEILA